MFLTRVKYALRQISVEPILVLYMLAFMMISVVEQEFFFVKACTIDFRYNESFCRRLVDVSRDYTAPLSSSSSSSASSSTSSLSSNLSDSLTIGSRGLPCASYKLPLVREYPSHLNSTQLLHVKMSIQKSMTSFLEINALLGNLISLLVALVVARFSDRFGRKILLIVGLAGRLVYTNGLLVVSILPTLNVYFVSIFATLPSSFFGGETFIFSNAFAYIADTTTLKNRSSRILILDLAYLTAIPVGLNCGAYFFNYVFSRSYTLMFLANIAITGVALIYALIRLEFTTAKDCSIDKIDSTINANSDEDRWFNCCGGRVKNNFWARFCGKQVCVKEVTFVNRRGENNIYDRTIVTGEPNYVIETPNNYNYRNNYSKNNYYNNNNNNNNNNSTDSYNSNNSQDFLTISSPQASTELNFSRKKLWLLLACSVFYAFHRSERNVAYMYTQMVFNWNLQQFTFYKTILSICFLIGILLFAILVRVTPSRLRDEYVIVVGCISHICGRFCYMGARTQQVFLVGGIVSGLGPTAAPCIKSLVSKITPSRERGEIFTYVSVIDSFVPLLSSLLYLRLYKLLSEIMERSFDLSYFYFLTVATQLACIFCIVTYAYLDNRWPANLSQKPTFPSSRSSLSPSSTSVGPLLFSPALLQARRLRRSLDDEVTSGKSKDCGDTGNFRDTNKYRDKDETEKLCRPTEVFIERRTTAKRNSSLQMEDSTIPPSLSLSDETLTSNVSSPLPMNQQLLSQTIHQELSSRLVALTRETYV